MKYRDYLSALIACSVGGAAYYLSGDYAAEARVFPRLIAGAMFICGILIFTRTAFLKTAGDSKTEDDGTYSIEHRVAMAVLLTVFYVASVGLFGYIASSLIFIPIASYLFGMRNFVTIGAVSVCIAFGVSYLFDHLFATSLPVGLIHW